MIRGGFEEAARLRRLRDNLWRAVWVQRHAYDAADKLASKDRPIPSISSDTGWAEASRRGDALFESAVQLQDDGVSEAERLGFVGKPEWIA